MHDRTEERLASTDCGLVEANSNVRFEKDGLGVRGWRRCAARDAAASEGLSGALVRLLGPSARTLEIDGRPKDCAVACWMIRISQDFAGGRRPCRPWPAVDLEYRSETMIHEQTVDAGRPCTGHPEQAKRFRDAGAFGAGTRVEGLEPPIAGFVDRRRTLFRDLDLPSPHPPARSRPSEPGRQPIIRTGPGSGVVLEVRRCPSDLAAVL